MDANGVAHLPRLQPALEADIPLAWQEDWRIIKSALGKGDNGSHLVVEVPDTPWGWAYHDFLVARDNVKDIAVMVTSVYGWTAKKLSELILALIPQQFHQNKHATTGTAASSDYHMRLRPTSSHEPMEDSAGPAQEEMAMDTTTDLMSDVPLRCIVCRQQQRLGSLCLCCGCLELACFATCVLMCRDSWDCTVTQCHNCSNDSLSIQQAVHLSTDATLSLGHSCNGSLDRWRPDRPSRQVEIWNVTSTTTSTSTSTTTTSTSTSTTVTEPDPEPPNVESREEDERNRMDNEDIDYYGRDFEDRVFLHQRRRPSARRRRGSRPSAWRKRHKSSGSGAGCLV